MNDQTRNTLFLAGLTVLGLLFMLSSCDKRKACTTPGEARCSGAMLQICAGDKKWTDNVDCTKTGNQTGVEMTCGVHPERKRAACLVK